MWMETDVSHLQKGGLMASLALAMASFSSQPLAQTITGETAQQLEQQGRNAEAEVAWKQISQAHGSDALPYAHLGLLEARQEHFAQAVVYYRKALALNPELAGLRLNLGLALFKDGQYKPSLQLFTQLLKTGTASSSETQRLTVLIGMSHYGLGDYPSAIPYLQKASENDRSNLPLLLTLAHSCLLSKQYQCVLDAYHRMVTLNADSAEADMLVGEALDEMKDSVGATREFRAAVTANPKEPNAHFGLGYLLWTQKQYAEAAQEFQLELVNTPDNAKAMLYLADSNIQMNKMEAARALLEQLVKDDPRASMARLDLGIVYAEAGRNGEALRELKAAVALKPTEVDAHWRLGRLYRSMGNNAEAKSEFDKAKNLNKAADDALLDVLSTGSQKKTGAPIDRSTQ
jgi:tetratricopeptide (TPR) repeat protein